METLNYSQFFISAILSSSLSFLLNKKSKKPTITAPPSPYQIFLKTRESQINKFESVLKSLNPIQFTRHLAINLYDQVNKIKVYPTEKQEKLLIICLDIAYKYTEDHEQLTKQDLFFLLPDMSEAEILSLELEVLQLIDWKITQKNCLFYLYEFIEKIVNKKGSGKVLNHCLNLADLCLKVNEFLDEDPKIVAGTCIGFTMKKMGLKEVWNRNAEEVTGVSKERLRLNEIEEKYKIAISRD